MIPSEQVASENTGCVFRIKTYIVEVKKTTRAPGYGFQDSSGAG